MAFLQCLPFVTKRHLQQLHQTTKSGNINALCQQLVSKREGGGEERLLDRE